MYHFNTISYFCFLTWSNESQAPIAWRNNNNQPEQDLSSLHLMASIRDFTHVALHSSNGRVLERHIQTLSHFQLKCTDFMIVLTDLCKLLELVFEGSSENALDPQTPNFSLLVVPANYYGVIARKYMFNFS